MTRTLREMILGALDDAGGQDYLAEQAHKNPAAFMALLGRVLPRDLHIEEPPRHSTPSLTWARERWNGLFSL